MAVSSAYTVYVIPTHAYFIRDTLWVYMTMRCGSYRNSLNFIYCYNVGYFNMMFLPSPPPPPLPSLHIAEPSPFYYQIAQIQCAAHIRNRPSSSSSPFLIIMTSYTVAAVVVALRPNHTMEWKTLNRSINFNWFGKQYFSGWFRYAVLVYVCECVRQMSLVISLIDSN